MKEPYLVVRALNNVLKEVAENQKHWNKEMGKQAEKYEADRLKLTAKYEKQIAELEKTLVEWQEQSKVYEQEVIELKKRLKEGK